MKRLILILFLIISIGNCINAQDIITKTDNTVIKAKILEISSTELRYKKFDYLDGPTIILSVKEIKSINYPNGSIENYNNPIALPIKKETAQNNEITTSTVTVQGGFTNKAEAKNEIIKGVKQGKWIEYLDGNLNKTLSQDSANYYKLIIYKNGMIMETERIYNIEDVLYSENFYVDGKIEGTSKIFYNDGDILSEVPYKEGLKEGIAKSYNGIKGVSSEMPYSKGLMHGIAKTFNSEGLITSETNYDQGKKVNVKTYYKTGTLKSESPYLNNNLEGVEKNYYENGAIKNETLYSNGKIESFSRSYDDKGLMVMESIYLNNEIVNMKSYYDNGKLLNETPWKNGKMDGLKKTFNKDGTIREELYYSEDKVEGLSKTYLNRNGKNSLYKELHWSNGKIIESKTFNDDGTFTVYSHKEGEPDGIMKNYSNTGRLISYAVKENGVYKSYNPDGEELYKSNSGSLLKGALQIFQQVAAYQVYEKSPNTENFTKYMNVITNNFTKSPEEAIKANNNVLSEPINYASESSASTNGGSSSNPQQAAICAKKSAKEWETSKAYENYYMKNPACSKLGYIAQLEQAVILLKNCKQCSSPEDLEVLNKTISTLTSQINSMPDCESFRFDDPGKEKKPNITIVPTTKPVKNSNNGSGAVKAQ